MLSAYVPNGPALERVPVASDGDIPEAAVWFDLVLPTLPEDKLLERHLGIAVPTREEMQEIEVTSRLYVENNARYMTATLMCQSDTDTPKTTPVTFILSGHRLVTVRYDEPRPFMIVGNKLVRTCPQGATGESVLMDLLDAVIDRAADILERIGSEVDQLSHTIFEAEGQMTRSQREILRSIGRKGDLTSKVRESLVSIGRVLLYLANEAEGMKWAKEPARNCAACSATCSRCPTTPPICPTRSPSCSTACSASSFIEQNNIIKIFSIAAVVLMPPTLVASVYGMNFKYHARTRLEVRLSAGDRADGRSRPCCRI